MDEKPQRASTVTRYSPQQPWDIYGSLNEHYWSPSGREERRLKLAAFAGRQSTAVITARVQSSMLKSVLASLGRLPMVTLRGWTERGGEAHILLSVPDPLPTRDLNAILSIESITELEPDRDRTAAAYAVDTRVRSLAADCQRPPMPLRQPPPQSNLEEQEPIENMNLPQVRANRRASDHVVAVLDNGVEWEHPYLSSDIWINVKELSRSSCDGDGCGLTNDCFGWNFYDDKPDPAPHNSWPHGTSVAGLVMAVARSAGAATKVMPLRTSGPGERLSLSGLAGAIDYASAHGAHTIVIASGWSLKAAPDPAGAFALAEALKRAAFRQCLVVCAGGNSSMDIIEHEIEPACSGLVMNNVLTVLGAGENFNGSNYVPGHLHEVVVAPAGTDILSIATQGTMNVPFDSTSAAAGIMGGVSAVVASARQVAGAAQRKALLLKCRNPTAFASDVLIDHIFNCSFMPAAARIRVSRSTSSPSRSRPGLRPSRGGPAADRRPR